MDTAMGNGEKAQAHTREIKRGAKKKAESKKANIIN
jgi:hypothetical protein